MSDRTRPDLAARLSLAGAQLKENRNEPRGQQFLDEVIRTRIPQLYETPAARRLLPLVYRLVNHENASRLMHEWSLCRTGVDVIRQMHRTVKPQVAVSGIEHVPASGGCLLVSNHPTGLTDGVALFDPVRHVRQDVAVFVFHDLLSINPQASDALIPVEWRPSHQSTAKSRETFRIANKAFKSGRLVTIFPSGRMSYWNGRRIAERPWKDAFITFARRYKLPIVPAHIGSRNSVLYYGLSLISSTLRDLQSINEIQNKGGHRFRVTFGKPVRPEELDGSPATLTQCFQHYVEHILPAKADAAFTDLLDGKAAFA